MSLSPPSADAPLQRVRRFQRFTAWPVFVLSLAFFVASVWLLSGVTEPAVTAVLLQIALWSYLSFLADFLTRFILAKHERALFLRRNWFEAASLLVPILRPFVIVVYVWRLPLFLRSTGAMRVRFLITTVMFMLLFVYSAASMVWLVERGAPNANIVNLGDAIWWGFSTIATVGYGDYTPITIPGRVIAVGLMLGGIAIVGITSAMIISLLGEQLKLRMQLADPPAAAPPTPDRDTLTEAPSPTAPAATGASKEHTP